MTASVRVGLVGCGHWGANLARNLATLGVLKAICDSNADSVARLAHLYPHAVATTDLATILRDPDVDACVVATPPVTHARLARLALEHGKDVLVEKPLALSVRDAEALTEFAASRDRILMVGHLLEYHPAVEALARLIREGELGKIHYVYSNRLNLGRIRTEENALWSFAPHDVHVLLRLLGEAPVEVACHGGNYLNRDVADVTLSTMQFASGVRAHMFVSWLHPIKDQKLVVVGDRKMAVFDDGAASKLQLYPHRVDWIARAPIAVKAEPEIVPLPDTEPLAAECGHFLDCVAHRSRPRTDGANGVEVLRVLEMCQQSLEAGGAPVLLGRADDSPREAYYAHPTAIVERGANIGEGTRVWHFAHVMPGATVGRHCSLGQNVFVAGTAVIGNNVKIQNNVSVYDGVILEDDVFCGPSMVFTNVINPRSHVSRKQEYLPTVIRRGATIGANATVTCGHTVHAFGFVGAGAVVTRDVPAYALVLGVPARMAGWMCQCGVRLAMGVDEDGVEAQSCTACGALYRRTGHVVSPNG